MFGLEGATRTLGQFALVSYLPDPLGIYLDHLRLDLTPNCNPHAHVTVLPPRPLTAELKSTIEQLMDEGRLYPPFDIEVGGIEVFPKTNVIYLSLARGERDLHALHENLNAGRLEYHGPYPFHPHITIAQDFDPEQGNALVSAARERWAKFGGQRRFRLENMSLVQNVAPHTWVDIAQIPLAQAAVVGT